MTKKTDEAPAAHKNIEVALAAAQSEMTKALKSAANPHLKSNYADLGSVMDACMGPLNSNGIALVQRIGAADGIHYVETTLTHGESDTRLSCTVSLFIQKQDMQGYGSAVTYARRYGLMAMAGIAPEEDDGHAAAQSKPEKKIALITADQYRAIKDKADEADVTIEQITKAAKIGDLANMPADSFDSCIKKLEKTISKNIEAANLAREARESAMDELAKLDSKEVQGDGYDTSGYGYEREGE